MDQSAAEKENRPDKMVAQQTEVSDEVTLRRPHTPKNKQSSRVSSSDTGTQLTPNVLFKKMVEENQKRNSKVIQKLEIDRRLTNGQRGNKNSDQPTIKVRFCVCLLALTGLAFSQMSRMVINITITSMVDPRLLDTNSQVSLDGSCPVEQVLVHGHVDGDSENAIEGDLSDNNNNHDSSNTGSITDNLSDVIAEPTVANEQPLEGSTNTHHIIDTENNQGDQDQDQDHEPVTGRDDDTTIADSQINSENDQSLDPLRPLIDDAASDVFAEMLNHKNQPVDEQQQLTESQTDNSEMEPSSEEHNKHSDDNSDEHDSQKVAYSDRQTDTEQQHFDNHQQQQVNNNIASNNDDSDDASGQVETHNERRDDSNNGDGNQRKRRSIEPEHTDNHLIDNKQAESSTIEPMQDASLNDKFGWTTKQRNIVLGGFYSSYFVFMIIGGRMAEIYGSKYIILISVLGSALVNLFTPWMAKTNFYLLVASRVALGAMQSGIFPGCYALFAKWLTLSETSIFAPLIKVSLRLGSMLGSFVPGLIIDKSGVGWQNVFYTTGTLCLLWSIPWLLLVSSFPEDNRFVSKAELAHIVKKKRKFNGDIEATPMGELAQQNETPKLASFEPAPPKPKQDNSTPWLNIITSGPVIALIVVKLSFNYVVDFMCIQLPSYLKYVHHADQQQTSWIITPLFAIQVVLVTGVAYLAKEAVRRKPCGLQKTAIRKLFQGTASFGAALILFLVTLNNCSLLYVGISMQILSVLTMFVAGGEVVLPYDLSDEFQATIMGIANSVANLSGVTVTYMTAKILGEQGSSAQRWHLIINLIAAVSLLGGIIFILLARAEYIDFRASKQARKEKKNELNNRPNSQANSGVSKM